MDAMAMPATVMTTTSILQLEELKVLVQAMGNLADKVPTKGNNTIEPHVKNPNFEVTKQREGQTASLLITDQSCSVLHAN